MKIGDKVTYAKTRETQDVQPERRNATGYLRELAEIDGETCAKVSWDWAYGVGYWVKIRNLAKV